VPGDPVIGSGCRWGPAHHAGDAVARVIGAQGPEQGGADVARCPGDQQPQRTCRRSGGRFSHRFSPWWRVGSECGGHSCVEHGVSTGEDRAQHRPRATRWRTYPNEDGDGHLGGEAPRGVTAAEEGVTLSGVPDHGGGAGHTLGASDQGRGSRRVRRPSSTPCSRTTCCPVSTRAGSVLVTHGARPTTTATVGSSATWRAARAPSSARPRRPGHQGGGGCPAEAL